MKIDIMHIFCLGYLNIFIVHNISTFKSNRLKNSQIIFWFLYVIKGYDDKHHIWTYPIFTVMKP